MITEFEEYVLGENRSFLLDMSELAKKIDSPQNLKNIDFIKNFSEIELKMISEYTRASRGDKERDDYIYSLMRILYNAIMNTLSSNISDNLEISQEDDILEVYYIDNWGGYIHLMDIDVLNKSCVFKENSEIEALENQYQETLDIIELKRENIEMLSGKNYLAQYTNSPGMLLKASFNKKKYKKEANVNYCNMVSDFEQTKLQLNAIEEKIENSKQGFNKYINMQNKIAWLLNDLCSIKISGQ